MAASTGLGLLVGGTRLLGRRYHLLGQGAMGGGLAILYFSVYAAYHFYQLIETNFAFVLMGAITLLAGGVSVIFSSMLVAILGILGGYGTPVILATATVDLVGLNTYILILGVGVLGVCYWKNWPLVNYLSFVCTYTLYFASMTNYTPSHFHEVFPFLTAYFILFSTMTFLYQMVNRTSSSVLDLAALVINGGIYFVESHRLISAIADSDWVAAVSLGLAIFYALHVLVFFRWRLIDRNLLICFFGMSSFFVMITPPLVLSREWITFLWAAQALVMMWIGRQLGANFVLAFSHVLYAIVVFRFIGIDLPRQFLVPFAQDTP